MFFNLFNKNRKLKMPENIYYNELPSAIKMHLEVLKGLDVYTRKHIEDVPKQVYKICKMLNFSGEKTDFLMIAAYLHDVGKIFIPPEILQKPEKLTPEEFDIMKTHTIKGYNVCMSYDDLHQYAKIVRGHHECLDGSGYPDGLTANKISYETGIIKVADVYSALSSKRQYKRSFTTKEIFEIMSEDVAKGKMNGEILYYLLLAIIEEKDTEMRETEHSLVGYSKQLKDNEYILGYLEKYVTEKMSDGGANFLSDSIINKYVRKLRDFDIEKISDANKLLIYINNDIMRLTKDLNNLENLKKEVAELTGYAKYVMQKWY